MFEKFEMKVKTKVIKNKNYKCREYKWNVNKKKLNYKLYQKIDLTDKVEKSFENNFENHFKKF